MDIDQIYSTTPLVVDLDGTLIKTDLLIEAFFAYLGHDFLGAIRAAGAVVGGKAALKHKLASQVKIDASLLPYDDAVLALITKARSDGRPVYLATASHERKAQSVATHLGLFHGVFATTEISNLAGTSKAKALVKAFGVRGFDYVGNAAADVAIWQEARHAYAVRATPAVRRQAERMGVTLRHVETSTSPWWRTWLKALRVHQYLKNTLIFVPLLTSHSFGLDAVLAAFLAFLSFSAAASAVYILNDLVDIEADRRHPTKCLRAFASGALSVKAGLLAMAGLFVAAFVGASQLSLNYLLVLAGYVALTTAYSLYIKRKMLVDIVVLALLYTVRVIAGGVAIDVVLSEWLLTFSLFIFTSLALIKRYVELATRLDRGMEDPTNRNYLKTDLVVIGGLAAASGMNAVTVFALYLSSPAVVSVYTRPKILWLTCPILIYILGRMLIMAHRRILHEDPIVFAISDRISRLAVLLISAIVLVAR